MNLIYLSSHSENNTIKLLYSIHKSCNITSKRSCQRKKKIKFFNNEEKSTNIKRIFYNHSESSSATGGINFKI